MRFPHFTARRRLIAVVAAGLTIASLGALGPLSTPAAAPGPTVAAVAALAGDDNRDGVIDEDESGWDCRTMGNRVCGEDVPAECEGAGDVLALCVKVANRPPFGWNGPDGEIEGDLPDGRTLLRDLWVKPGDPEFADFVAAYDADWRRVHP